MEEGKLQEGRKREEAERKREEADKIEKGEEKMAKAKQSMAKSEEDLMQEEVATRADLEAADKLLIGATSKLHDALSGSSVNKQSVSVASMMLDTAQDQAEQAMQSLGRIRNRRIVGQQNVQIVGKGHIIPSTKTAMKKKFQDKDNHDTPAKKAKKNQSKRFYGTHKH